eukprot:GHVN01065728.1.p1 GENE.GHVN01065728.1~~GHVN01065728.1.p1  ORF type:complete len:1909 (-),score=197.04 GHVN01065728.1:4706-10432(-)
METCMMCHRLLYDSLYVFAIAFLLLSSCSSGKEDDVDALATKYNPKNCKYHPLPTSLDSYGYLKGIGEVYLADVFGVLQGDLDHEIFFTAQGTHIVTLSAELHHETSAEFLHANLYAFPPGSDEQDWEATPRLWGEKVTGAGGERTKVHFTGIIGENTSESSQKFVIRLSLKGSINVAKSVQSETFGGKTSCLPVRMDLAILTIKEIQKHLPPKCPVLSILPDRQTEVLDDKGISHSNPPGKPYVFAFGEDKWKPFQKAVWTTVIEAPRRLHRFVRLRATASFRFISGPVQLLVELIPAGSAQGDSGSDISFDEDGIEDLPECKMGCIGGTPTYNGQLLNHAFPTGFKYKVWLLAGEPIHTNDPRTQCIEFDLSLKASFEARQTPFDVGEHSWLCPHSRLPDRLVQKSSHDTDDIEVGTIQAQSLHIADHFAFPPDEMTELFHKIAIEISEMSLLRVVVTQASLDVRVILSSGEHDEPVQSCRSLKNPSAVQRNRYESIFCQVAKGDYNLYFYGEYPLGGLPPCDGFNVQLSIKPAHLVQKYASCGRLGEERVLSLSRIRQSKHDDWTSHEVRVIGSRGSDGPHHHKIGEHEARVQNQPVSHSYLRVAMRSDFLHGHIRAVVKKDGETISTLAPTAFETLEMLGPLASGVYTVQYFYQTLTSDSSLAFHLSDDMCASVAIDTRILERTSEEWRDERWACPLALSPIPHILEVNEFEEALLDQEYLVPQSGRASITVRIPEKARYIFKLQSGSSDLQAQIKLQDSAGLTLASDKDRLFWNIDQSVTKIVIIFHRIHESGMASACPVVKLHVVLQPISLIPVCPWALNRDVSGAFRTILSSTQRQQAANDHLGDLAVDLEPKRISNDLYASPPTHLWMGLIMHPKFSFSSSHESTVVRVEVTMHPPWLPLVVHLYKKLEDQRGIRSHPLASSSPHSSRVILMAENVGKGDYEIHFTMFGSWPADEQNDSAHDHLINLCSHVTVNSEVGENDESIRNTVRAELLDIPSMFPVENLPESLNQVGWLSLPDSCVSSTSLLNFNENSSTRLDVQKETYFGLHSEPIVLSGDPLKIVIKKTDSNDREPVASSSGTISAVLSPGSHVIEFEGNSPYLITLAISARNTFPDLPSLSQCAAEVAELRLPVTLPERVWRADEMQFSIDPSGRRKTLRDALLKTSVEVTTPSVFVLEVGTPLVFDTLQVGVKVPEGLWLSEQRGKRSVLRIEVPAGRFDISVAPGSSSHTNALQFGSADQCLSFSFSFSSIPINSESQETGQAECRSYGTSPLPLDVTTREGGSEALGGPFDQTTGRLLIRSRVLVSDLHDGRKKVYFAFPKDRDLVLKLGVYNRPTTSNTGTPFHHVQVRVQTKERKSISPSHGEWVLEEEQWERVYPLSDEVHWLIFRQDHMETLQSGCLLFDMLLQIMPRSDLRAMSHCPEHSISYDGFFTQNMLLTAMMDHTNTPTELELAHLVTPLSFVRQPREGFIASLPFKLDQDAVVLVEVRYNQFVSHIEMDIVRDRSGGSRQSPSDMNDEREALGEMDFIGKNSDTLTARQWIATGLSSGRYVLHIADDHYGAQFEGSEACFPLSFKFSVLKASSQIARIVAVHPEPGRQLLYGQDLVVFIRLSVPVQGDEMDVARQIALVSDNSKPVHPRMFSRSEGGLVLTALWRHKELIPLGGIATLKFAEEFVSEEGSPFSFASSALFPNGLTYTIPTHRDMHPHDKAPWAGESPRHPSDQERLNQQPKVQGGPMSQPEVVPLSMSEAEAVGVVEPEHGRDLRLVPPKADSVLEDHESLAQHQLPVLIERDDVNLPEQSQEQDPNRNSCGPGKRYEGHSHSCVFVRDFHPHPSTVFAFSFVSLLLVFCAWRLSRSKKRIPQDPTRLSLYRRGDQRTGDDTSFDFLDGSNDDSNDGL